MLKTLNTFIEIAAGKSKKKIAVAAAEDQPVLEAVAAARKENIVEPILVGNRIIIEEISSKINFDLKGIDIINEINPVQACKISVGLIRENKAQILMKGMVNTADYLRAILDKENGLRTGQLLSHIGFFELKKYHKLLAVTDVAQNIAPTLEEKIDILNNAVDCFHRIGIVHPKIAVVAAVETVNPKMEATIHAALLTMMNRRKQINGCIIDGPLGFDNAISKESAEHKGIVSEVSGDVDLLLTPDIESGNILYKSLTYFADAKVAAIILGASVPIVLTSRSDSNRSKLMSIALAASY
ncbi:MAG: phosphate butyryltransferase [Ignavibacteria bacterium GWB2_35_12]|nr:MAG: phosphate butyryltransferase [Ignavibacteria bacterium GWA2_35_8]OGU41645.1 MAG: phosphate butyryltransferase [Ignavibacteria bacterium GWB2_35_12]OGU91383.1 MAG: phosphate butyryltransferase [Ignavibacteria bacterium RIFOXYA2_FULL_35_10]OGV24980.1 MAG: phosphate butyryltransferase [Ignavibacteria bacterium RIFOXYC2_FULL_35_21]